MTPQRAMTSLLVLLLSTTGAIAAGSAPAQLRGKSVTIVWDESGTYKRSSDGQQRSAVGRLSRIVYISDAGRAFVRGTSVSGTFGNTRETGPEGTGGSVDFSGNSMTSFRVNRGVARRLVVTFDPAFSSCTGTLTIGKSGPGTTIKGFDGQIYEVLSMQPGTISCSIRAGNAFAN